MSHRVFNLSIWKHFYSIIAAYLLMCLNALSVGKFGYQELNNKLEWLIWSL